MLSTLCKLASKISLALVLALSACGSDSDGGPGGDAGKYYGSCDESATDSKMCSDQYCSGSQCDTLMSNPGEGCKGTFSQTKCKAGTSGSCSLPTTISGNTVTAVSNYYDGTDHESACTAFGGTYQK